MDKDISGRRLFQESGDLFHDGLIFTDDILADLRDASYETAVTLRDQVALEKLDRVFKALFILGKKNEASRIHVDTMAKIHGRVVIVSSQDIDEAVAAHAFAAMYGNALTLIDQKKVIRLENDFVIIKCRLLRLCLFFEHGVRKPYLNVISFAYGHVGRDAFAVDTDIFVLKCFLQRSRRQIRKFQDRSPDDLLAVTLRGYSKMLHLCPLCICNHAYYLLFLYKSQDSSRSKKKISPAAQTVCLHKTRRLRDFFFDSLLLRGNSC